MVLLSQYISGGGGAAQRLRRFVQSRVVLGVSYGVAAVLTGIFSLRQFSGIFHLTAPDPVVLVESILLALVAATWTAAVPALRPR